MIDRDHEINTPDRAAGRSLLAVRSFSLEEYMPGLTVTEKEHWKERIARRIDKRIEVLTAGEPNLMDRIQQDARQRALQSLGLAELQAELDTIEQKKEELERRENEAHRAMVAIVRRVPAAQVELHRYGSNYEQEVSKAVERRRAVHEDELLAEDTLGQKILRLRLEKDTLLDTIWLATSPVQLRDLWTKVGELLGDELTALQQQVLAPAPAGAIPSPTTNEEPAHA
jgi:hypothetical protein